MLKEVNKDTDWTVLNIERVGVDKTVIFSVLFASDFTSKVSQTFVPQGKTLENSQLWTRIKPKST